MKMIRNLCMLAITLLSICILPSSAMFAGGYEASGVIADGKISVDVINNTASQQSATITVGAYDSSGQLKAAHTIKEDISGAGGGCTVEWNVSEYAGCSFKAFVWDGQMVPLIPAIFIRPETEDILPEPEMGADKTSTQSLAGTWNLKLGTYSAGDKVSDTCILPGTLDENQKGNKNTKAESGRLTRKYTYTGAAVYQKKVMVPADWDGKSVTLLLERTKKTRVWVNDKEQTLSSSNTTIAAAQEYDLTGLVAGAENTLTIEVDNSNYSSYFGNGNEARSTKTHMLTEETQTNWNGILGRIELQAKDNTAIKDMMVYPDIQNNTAHIKLVINKKAEEAVSGKITFDAQSYNHSGEAVIVPKMQMDVSLKAGSGETTLEYTYPMGEDVKLWSEFHPSLYKLVADMTLANGSQSNYKTSFGMREFGTGGTQFTINGNKTFLRGEANSAVFPITGYAYTTVGEWLEFFTKAQDLGINFFRFHSWIPPEAAFEAADLLGIYMQPELYGFGGTPDFSGYFKDEAERILKYYANHPSFVMLTWGNEMTIDGTAAETGVNTLREFCRGIDSTRLYAEGTNNDFNNAKINPEDDFWTTAKIGKAASGDPDQYNIRMSFAWNNAISGGFLESLQPNTEKDYSSALTASGVQVPVMNHEAGQYQTIPNFDKEIPKYEKGIFAAKNLERFRSIMEGKGLLAMNQEFAKATARTSAIQYRADIEAALRTPGFGGYQLLSIQDFPGQNTALVGILDSFMEDKEGGFTKEEYKSFNSPVTVLGKLPKLMYASEDEFVADVVLTNYSESDLQNISGAWAVKHEDGTIVKSDTFQGTTVPQGSVTTIGSIKETSLFDQITRAEKLVFEVRVDGLNTKNTYPIWVYPTMKREVPEGVLVADAYTKEVRDTLAAGGKVVLFEKPTEENLPNSVAVRWTNDFWSTMFHGRAGYEKCAFTMGMYVHEGHPVFNDFPTEYFSDYQWFNLMKNSRAVILDNAPAALVPMAQNIDHMAYSRRLGSLFEAKAGTGSLLVCTMDILNYKDQYPEVQQLYNSIMEYAGSGEFAPEVEVTTEYLSSILKPVLNSDGGIFAYDENKAFSYSWCQTKTDLSKKSGKDEKGDAVSNAVGNISAGDMLQYGTVVFNGNGASKITLSGANGGTSKMPAQIEVYAGSVYGKLIQTIEFDYTGSWESFKKQTFEMPRLTGTQDLVFKFVNANFIFDSFTFEQDLTEYQDPYTGFDPSNTTGDVTVIEDLGGAHQVQQLTTQVDGKVKFTFKDADFGIDGASGIILGGAPATADGRIFAELAYDGRSIPIVFRAGVGEKYSVESGTTGGLEFWKNTIGLPEAINGRGDISIIFDEATDFQFESIQFVQGDLKADGREAYEAIFYAKDTTLEERFGNGIKVVDNKLAGMAAPNDMVKFSQIDFGDRGVEEITLSASNSAAEPAVIRIWYSSLDYVDMIVNPSSGQETSVKLPEVKGIHDIRLQLCFGEITLDYITFREQKDDGYLMDTGIKALRDSRVKLVDCDLKKIAVIANTTGQEVSSRIASILGGKQTYTYLSANTPVPEGQVLEEGMKLKVTSENGLATEEYTITLYQNEEVVDTGIVIRPGAEFVKEISSSSITVFVPATGEDVSRGIKALKAGNQTYIYMNAQKEEIPANTRLQSGCYLKVTSENGEQEAYYAIIIEIPDRANNDVDIVLKEDASAVKAIAGRQISVEEGTRFDTVVSEVTSMYGMEQTYSFGDKAGTDIAENQDRMTVTSPNGSCQEEYTLILRTTAQNNGLQFADLGVGATAGRVGTYNQKMPVLEADKCIVKQNGNDTYVEMSGDINSVAGDYAAFDYEITDAGSYDVTMSAKTAKSRGKVRIIMVEKRDDGEYGKEYDCGAADMYASNSVIKSFKVSDLPVGLPKGQYELRLVFEKGTASGTVYATVIGVSFGANDSNVNVRTRTDAEFISSIDPVAGTVTLNSGCLVQEVIGELETAPGQIAGILDPAKKPVSLSEKVLDGYYLRVIASDGTGKDYNIKLK